MSSDFESEAGKAIVDIIKSFRLIIGNKSNLIAEKVFSNLKKNRLVDDVLVDEHEVRLVFKRGAIRSIRRRILIKALKDLRNNFANEVGVVADRMINFIVKDLSIKF